jgi:hypothetical protein
MAQVLEYDPGTPRGFVVGMRRDHQNSLATGGAPEFDPRPS